MTMIIYVTCLRFCTLYPIGHGDGTCDVPDGRSIPAGQEFPLMKDGMSLICTCPIGVDREVDTVNVECRSDTGGKHSDGLNRLMFWW